MLGSDSPIVMVTSNHELSTGPATCLWFGEAPSLELISCLFTRIQSFSSLLWESNPPNHDLTPSEIKTRESNATMLTLAPGTFT